MIWYWVVASFSKKYFIFDDDLCIVNIVNTVFSEAMAKWLRFGNYIKYSNENKNIYLNLHDSFIT